ncbi:MAG: hypothetical protein MUE60_11740 [Candidatus Eisenbacteria bacterium]|nr:hypothetical protein [Candidatus Eisenbacteria bacterium]
MFVRCTVVLVALIALVAACQPKPQDQVPPTPSPAVQAAPKAEPVIDVATIDSMAAPMDSVVAPMDSLAQAPVTE